jgi:diguanylate cyclase (GGDEF)-like protein
MPEVKLVSSQALEQLPIFNHLNVQSAAMLPLVRHGVLVGSLHLGAQGEQRFTMDKSTDFITHLASIVAVCLENGVNQERLRRLSMYDMLTQVKNRRAFHKALDEEVSRAGRNGEPLSMLFIDLDSFKVINDSYGHPLGDKVLKEVAQYIDKMLRKTDHVCRYGGEEFALVLPNCSKSRALEIAERIRLKISQLVIVNDTASEDLAREISVTLSIGVCRWLPDTTGNLPSGQDVVRQLIDCSDRGVYQSKAAGRNCVHYVDICA